MTQHRARISWQRDSEDFSYAAYNRGHEWHFENGVTVLASAAPAYLGTADRIDPEEAFVAAVSSCHMLTFLALCARKRLVVDSYEDDACGVLEKNADGKLAITRVSLRPRIVFQAETPPAQVIQQLHHVSHQECFIASSINTRVEVLQPEPAA